MAIFVSNIVIEQGFDFGTYFQLEDTITNNLLDLTGYTMEAQLRKTYSSSSSVSFASSISDPSEGLIQISLGSTETSLLKPGRYVYDVKLTTNEGLITKAVEGAALVRSGVTR